MLYFFSVKELWQAVDSKPGPWRFSRWEGHILTYIRQNLFQFESMRVDPKLPFARITSMTGDVKIVNRQAPVVSNVDELCPESCYHFSHEFMRKLFDAQEHPAICIAGSVEEALSTPD